MYASPVTWDRQASQLMYNLMASRSRCLERTETQGPGWRNWQTQRTQNPPRFTPRGGSTPPPGTTLSLLLPAIAPGDKLPNRLQRFPMPASKVQKASSLRLSKLIGFAITTQPEKAKTFYSKVLGFRFVKDDGFALVFDAHGTMLRISKLKQFTPAEFTVLGW